MVPVATRQVVSPIPDAQRLLPLSNFEQKSPDLQSLSAVQVSHSSPLLRQLAGNAIRTRASSRNRVLLIGPPPALHRDCSGPRRGEESLLFDGLRSRVLPCAFDASSTERAMSDVDLRATLNLPKTDFPMKANLPQAEPRRLAEWKAQDLYGQIRRARAGRPTFVLHDGPPYANGHIHLGTVLNKILKDVVVRSRSMTGKDAPYRPGWDCHGLPIELKVDRDLGARKRELSPLEFRRACREYAEKFVAVQRSEFERLGVLGEWDDPYLTMSPAYQATILRQLAEFVEAGLVYKAKKSVHWCISCRTALAEAEVEYDEQHVSPSIEVRFPLADADRDRLATRHPALAGRHVSAVIWTTTPWTLPANLALAFHPDAEYGFYPLEGTGDVLLLAKALKDASEARWHAKGNPAGAPPRLGEPLAQAKGSELEHLRFRHPWIDRDSPALLADYVTLDTGTGVVHTAPGHGWDDYLTGVRYGLDIYCPVDEGGRFLPEVEHFAGQRVFDANPAVIELLRNRGALLAAGRDTHSYPICWRCKHPIIFRATEQWFIALDQAPGGPRADGPATLRERALGAIADTRWIPAWGQERIHNMIATRPDWCISRQRLWGVPIPAFYCDGCGAVLLRADLVRHVALRFEKETADAWYGCGAAELLPPGFACPDCGSRVFRKETDILDVWFDSGSSHAAVLGKRPDLPWPADVYLEGSDQHRGWFHSSLLIGVATRGRAPYDTVVTHGFTVDAEGKKISKSLGNDVDTQKLINGYGAEVLRMWTIMVDYREDMRISDDMIKRVAEAYRKLRNTLRYLLSNLYDFDPARDGVAEAALDELDRYALQRHRQVVSRVLDAYDSYEFHLVYHQLVQYAAADLSSFYLDVLKDRLYCDAAGGPRRRSAQTVLHRIARDLCLLLAPVLPFTTDEAFSLLPGGAPGAVHLAVFPPRETADEGVLARWDGLLSVRAEANKALEEARAAKQVAASLEAALTVRGPETALAPLRAFEAQSAVFPGNLANLFIVSGVSLQPAEGPLSVSVAHAAGSKCERCWTWSEAVGRLPAHPAVCERCAEVLTRP
jgi:isoleucyl-tRNA synthetase